MLFHLFFKQVTNIAGVIGLDTSGKVKADDRNETLSENALVDIQYKLFWTLWAVATLFHMANHRTYANGMHYVLLTFAAIYLIIKPQSIFRILFLLLVQLYQVSRMMPFASNHWLFVAFVNLTILHVMLYLVIKRRSFRINRVEFYKTFAPLVRIELIVLYFYVVLHKLNADFFSMDTSCAADLFIAQNKLSFVPVTATTLLLSAYGTVIIETIIPVFLCFRKTRNLGILIGMLFHFVIAFNPLNGFYDFSAMIFAAYVVFTSDSLSSYINFIYTKGLEIKDKAIKYYYSFNLAKAILAVACVLVFIAFLHFVVQISHDFFRDVLWSSYGASCIVIFLFAVLFNNKKREANAGIFTFKHFSLLLFPLIVFLNGMSPYLGLKTEGSFSMFSNLRTEGGVTNHFFMPVEMQLFNYQKDEVEIISSTDQGFRHLADNGILMTHFTFVNDINYVKPEKVEYLRNGKLHVYDAANLSPDDELSQKPSFILNKLLLFRKYYKNGKQPCSH